MSNKTTGQRIESLLKKRGLTQKELAHYLGVTDNTVSYWCNDHRMPNLEQIIIISKYLNVSIDYLTGITDIECVLNTDKNKLLRSICDYTGLSDEVIKKLHAKKGCYILFDNINDIFKFVYGIED